MTYGWWSEKRLQKDSTNSMKEEKNNRVRFDWNFSIDNWLNKNVFGRRRGSRFFYKLCKKYQCLTHWAILPWKYTHALRRCSHSTLCNYTGSNKVIAHVYIIYSHRLPFCRNEKIQFRRKLIIQWDSIKLCTHTLVCAHRQHFASAHTFFPASVDVHAETLKLFMYALRSTFRIDV